MTTPNHDKTIMEKIKDGERFTPQEWMDIMPPPILEKMLSFNYNAGEKAGSKATLEEAICRLLASGMSAEEISVVLCVNPDVVNDALQEDERIKTYARQLKSRRKSRENRAKK